MEFLPFSIVMNGPQMSWAGLTLFLLLLQFLFHRTNPQVEGRWILQSFLFLIVGFRLTQIPEPFEIFLWYQFYFGCSLLGLPRHAMRSEVLWKMYLANCFTFVFFVLGFVLIELGLSNQVTLQVQEFSVSSTHFLNGGWALLMVALLSGMGSFPFQGFYLDQFQAVRTPMAGMIRCLWPLVVVRLCIGLILENAGFMSNLFPQKVVLALTLLTAVISFGVSLFSTVWSRVLGANILFQCALFVFAAVANESTRGSLVSGLTQVMIGVGIINFLSGFIQRDFDREITIFDLAQNPKHRWTGFGLSLGLFFISGIPLSSLFDLKVGMSRGLMEMEGTTLTWAASIFLLMNFLMPLRLIHVVTECTMSPLSSHWVKPVLGWFQVLLWLVLSFVEKIVTRFGLAFFGFFVLGISAVDANQETYYVYGLRPGVYEWVDNKKGEGISRGRYVSSGTLLETNESGLILISHPAFGSLFVAPRSRLELRDEAGCSVRLHFGSVRVSAWKSIRKSQCRISSPNSGTIVAARDADWGLSFPFKTNLTRIDFFRSKRLGNHLDINAESIGFYSESSKLERLKAHAISESQWASWFKVADVGLPAPLALIDAEIDKAFLDSIPGLFPPEIVEFEAKNQTAKEVFKQVAPKSNF